MPRLNPVSLRTSNIPQYRSREMKIVSAWSSFAPGCLGMDVSCNKRYRRADTRLPIILSQVNVHQIDAKPKYIPDSHQLSSCTGTSGINHNPFFLSADYYHGSWAATPGVDRHLYPKIEIPRYLWYILYIHTHNCTLVTKTLDLPHAAAGPPRTHWAQSNDARVLDESIIQCIKQS